MKVTSIIAFIFMFFLTNACVTTRAQLHEERGDPQPVSEEDSSVTSEPIHTRSSRAPVATQPPASSGNYSLEETKELVAQLTGRVDELEQKLSKSADANEVKKLQDKVDELDKKLTALTAVPAPTPVPENKDYFQIGKDAYHAGREEDAVQALEEYLKNPSTKNQEEAIYLKGEAHFKLKNYKKAIVEFSKFPEKFPKSSYHPKALLRMGEAFEGLGMKEDGKAFYSDLAEKFPKTPEGKAAKKRLASPSPSSKKKK